LRVRPVLVGALLACAAATAGAQSGIVPTGIDPGGDAEAPRVSIIPSGGTYTSASLAVTIEWCDDKSLNATTRSVKLNGVAVTTTYTTATKAGCGKFARSTATLTLTPGTNTLTASIRDSYNNTGSGAATYTLNVPAATVSVTPESGSAVVTFQDLSLASAVVPFTVTNTSTGSPGTFRFTCTHSGAVGNCGNNQQVTLNAQAATTVNVPVTWTGLPGTSGTVVLRALNVADTTKADTGAKHVTAIVASGSGSSGNLRVKITPDSRSFRNNTTSVPVAVTWCSDDDGKYYPGWQWVTANGRDVTSQFQLTGHGSGTELPGLGWCGFYEEQSGTLDRSVLEDQAQLSAIGYNWSGYMQQTNVTYAWPVPDRAVEVIAESQTSAWRAGRTESLLYRVRNRSELPEWLALTARCTGAAVGGACASSPDSLLLQPLEEAVFAVEVTTGAIGDTGTVAVTAHTTRLSNPGFSDSTWTEVRIVASPPAGVQIIGSRDVLERDLCVTIAAGSDAASECGDLRLVHALPSVRTLGKTRTPTLLYNSQHAAPLPLVAADVTLPQNGGATPTSVRASVLRDGSEVAAASWSGTQWGASGETRRVVVPVQSWTTGSGAFRYILSVTTSWSNGSTTTDTASSTIAVVDRRGSSFGAGWWLAGLEELKVVHTDTLFWIGGDGSTRLYTRSAGGSVFHAARVDRPDSVTVVAGGGYIRWAPLRTEVRFNSTGRHESTTNRLQHVTRFHYASATSRQLDSVQVPTRGVPLTYRFTYVSIPGAGSVLHTVEAPQPRPGVLRTTSIQVTSVNGVARIDAIGDPDGTWVRFSYGAGGASSSVVTSRTNRRLSTTTYVYDAGRRLASHSTPLSESASITVALKAAESRGIAGSPALPLDSVYTLIDGPRTDVRDVTKLWVNGYGAPTRLRDARGRETSISYDPSWPGLVSATRNAARLVSRAAYDPVRGVVNATTVENSMGDGRPAIARYHWHPRWELPDSVISPTGLVTTFGYSDTTGNRLWQQTGGSERRASFHHSSLGLVDSVSNTVTGPEVFLYDTLGNLSVARSPMGFYSLSYGDAIGQDTLTISPVDASSGTSIAGVAASGSKQWTYFDAVGRDTLTRLWGPAATVAVPGSRPPNSGIDTLTMKIEKRYDPEGNVTRIERVLPRGSGEFRLGEYWVLDAVGRDTAHRASSSSDFEIRRRDPAGNVVEVRTARGHVITSLYDELNRLRERRTPQITIDEEYASYPIGEYFPIIGRPDSSVVCIAADTARYSYDAVGNMTRADNGIARVRRGYLRNGLLGADTLRIRAYYYGGRSDCDPIPPPGLSEVPPASLWAHSYVAIPSYDLDGRRTALTFNGSQNHSVAFSPTTGEPIALTTGAGTFGFHHDAIGRLDTLYAPGGVHLDFTYDEDNRLTARAASAPAQQFISDMFTYDARGRVIQGVIGYRGLASGPYSASVSYNGFGAVVASQGLTADNSIEQFGVDELGNRTWYQATNVRQAALSDDGQRLSTYNSMRQLLSVTHPDPIHQGKYAEGYQYDGTGNTTGTSRTDNWTSGLTEKEESRSYYDAEQRLRLFNRYKFKTGDVVAQGLHEEYWYDALGRRVLVRSQRTASEERLDSYLERTVWDRDQILAEIRTPAPDSTASAVLENDNPQSGATDGDRFGRVEYVHGGGIDQPLTIARWGLYNASGPVTVLPYANWRGGYEIGTLPSGVLTATCDGTDPDCPLIAWPSMAETTDGAPVAGPAISTWYGSLIGRKTDGSGLQYMRNRYYDPKTGRFTQSDPIGLAGGLNLYGFAAGDPVNHSDPFGLMACPPMCGPSQRHIQIEAQFQEDLTPRDRLALGGMAVAAAAGPGLFARVASLFMRAPAAAAGASVLAQRAGESGRRVMADGGSRVLSLSQHFHTGSPGGGAGSVASRDWGSIGATAARVEQAAVQAFGDYQSLQFTGRSVDRFVRMGDATLQVRAFVQQTGEVTLNAWIRSRQ
jgi:RHS repeat-associated protein